MSLSVDIKTFIFLMLFINTLLGCAKNNIEIRYFIKTIKVTCKKLKHLYTKNIILAVCIVEIYMILHSIYDPGLLIHNLFLDKLLFT